MKSQYASQWKTAEQEELAALNANDTWTVVPRPPRAPVISCRWVYKFKLTATNTIQRFKARLVAKCYLQTQGIDYNETFAAVALMKTFRVLLALSVILGWSITQLDVNNAFLYGILAETIYMNCPPGYPGPLNHVLKLKKCIYGLKQSGRTWLHTLTAALLKNGFVQLLSDTCVFIHLAKMVIISVHVDDIIVLTALPASRAFVVKNVSPWNRLTTVKVF